jgi:8-oxo-dGTP pyrophosphatase MutT (NUDIX family)
MTGAPWVVAWSAPGERLLVESQSAPGHTRYRFRSNGPGDGAVVIARRDDRILVIGIDRPAVGARLLELPRGQAEARDLSPLATAARELHEETGHTLVDGVELGVVWPDSGLSADGVHVVLGTDVRDAVATDPAPEFPDQRWLTCGELDAAVRDGTIRDAISLAALALLRASGSHPTDEKAGER